MVCQHCERGKVCRPRGLCWSCYYKPAIRNLYGPAIICGSDYEPTEAELDAMIAERSRPENLPAWWFASEEVQRRKA